MNYKSTENGTLEFPTHQDILNVFSADEDSPQKTGGFEQITDDEGDAAFKARYVPANDIGKIPEPPRFGPSLEIETLGLPGYGVVAATADDGPSNKFMDMVYKLNPFYKKRNDGVEEMEMQVQGDDQENLLSSLLNRMSDIVDVPGGHTPPADVDGFAFTKYMVPSLLALMVGVVLILEIVQYCGPYVSATPNDNDLYPRYPTHPIVETPYILPHTEPADIYHDPIKVEPIQDKTVAPVADRDQLIRVVSRERRLMAEV